MDYVSAPSRTLTIVIEGRWCLQMFVALQQLHYACVFLRLYNVQGAVLVGFSTCASCAAPAAGLTEMNHCGGTEVQAGCKPRAQFRIVTIRLHCNAHAHERVLPRGRRLASFPWNSRVQRDSPGAPRWPKPPVQVLSFASRDSFQVTGPVALH